ncbi:MAG: hypothetical protein ACYDDF_01760 [Thermoplasmatota archaeon]
MSLTDILLGAALVVSGGTAYAASLRRAGFGIAAPFLATAFASAGWLLWDESVPLVPQILLLGSIVSIALAFLGDL